MKTELLTNRRDFLKGTLWMGATAALAGRVAHAAKVCGPGAMTAFAAAPLAKVRIGVVGLGMRGPGAVHRLSYIPGVELTALCDLYPERVAAQQKWLEGKGKPKALREYSGPEGWTAQGRTALDGAPAAAPGTPWKIELDFSSDDAPRVRYSLGGAVLTADGAEWLPLAGSVDSIRRVVFAGGGMLADFRGVQRALVSDPVEVPEPVFRGADTGGALAFPDAATFSIALVGTDAGFWYTAFAADALSDPFLSEAPSVRGTGGALTLSVDADASRHASRFVRIAVSRDPCEAAGVALEDFLAR